MKLYSYWRSSSAWRVRIALAWKNIEHQVVPVHLVRDGGQQHTADFRAQNPLSQVPVLEWETNGSTTRLTQSMAILEYLEETYPRPALLPSDGIARARVRQLAEIVNSGTQPLQNLALQNALRASGVDPSALVRGFIERGLQSLASISAPTVGRFMVGDSLSFADVFLVPQLYAARRFGVDVGAFPTLAKVEATCAVLPAFQAAHPDVQPDRETVPQT